MNVGVRRISGILHLQKLVCSQGQGQTLMKMNGGIKTQGDRVVCVDDQDVTLQVQVAVESLQADNIIAVPTDTIYGIAGLAQSVTAINKIYEIKQRDVNKPIAICVGEIKDVYKWGRVTVSEELLSELLPGPVTLVFERTAQLNPSLNPMTCLVGIRIPDHTFISSLARACGQPLALTSANVSAAGSTLSVQEFEHLWHKLDKVFDGGILGDGPLQRLGSTVIDLSCYGKYRIIRPGSAHKASLEVLHKFGLEEVAK
ncbi:yrdC domain-containing protein, mitochondrial [Lingula anatina]|uniref:Threonylcarbamoyl-AMP synthase n=1 Tax=Lingula anatina TaxID=7574 RepID=A0A1S3J0D6_LINAN|nr:yrdC domain-containing protein, mitochondrial [Lingula anatina]|eukprot:XP_013403269.1 yrdC domain-containing protein, mitochondrial [Lingula anatina]